MPPNCWKRRLIYGVSALAAAPEDCKSSTPPLCCVGRSVRSCFQPNGLRRRTSPRSSADRGRAARSRRRSQCQTSWRWCRASQTRAGALPFNCSAPLACAPKSCSTYSFARDGSGALVKRLPLAAKPSRGHCDCCLVTNGLPTGSSSRPLILQSFHRWEQALARIPSVARAGIRL
jgi:hypothetical protein